MTGIKQEIGTIRNRNIELPLSDADVQRLWEKAGKVGMTAGELLTSFIGDLVCGTYTNGSDERMYAEEWFERCGFSFTAKNTFLRYLLEHDKLGGFIFNDNAFTDGKEELAEMEALQEKDVDDLKEIECINNEIAYFQENIDRDFADYVTWCKGEQPGCAEEEIKKVREWYRNMKKERDSA